jgi:hypothetical protein
LLGFGSAALADTISPASFSANLGIGESVTVRKTVTITDAPTSALLDIVFVIDTTGSMGPAIADAKAAAAGILNDLTGFGNVFSAAGFYNDPQFNALQNNLTATAATTLATINALNAGVPGDGGDFAEQTYAGIQQAAQNATWRPGSSRFIVVLGDAPTKTPPDAATLSGILAAADAEVIGVRFNPGFGSGFPDSITAIGGTVFEGGTDPEDIADAILAGVGGSFETYSTVTVGDLGGGDPLIDVSTVCISADIGACAGADATGAYDRSVNRTFEFDVTFTRTGAGLASFDTHALVDGRIVASEADRFPTGVVVPAPGVLSLLGVALLGLGLVRRFMTTG